MSFGGLKKQFNKASQFVNEKIGKAEGSKVDENIIEYGKKIDVMNQLYKELVEKTEEYLQPNPTLRMKNKICETTKISESSYIHPESLISQILSKGRELDNLLGESCFVMSEMFQNMAKSKEELDVSLRSSVLNKLAYYRDHQIKDINLNRKKLEGRRLDYDAKKRKGKAATPQIEEELKAAEKKFSESTDIVLSLSSEHIYGDQKDSIDNLLTFCKLLKSYHQSSIEEIERAISTLEVNITECQSIVVPERKNNLDVGNFDDSKKAYSSAQSLMSNEGSLKSLNATRNSSTTVPHCKALYDFKPENDDELELYEGDIVELKERIDENWFMGKNRGKTGIFPSNFVEIVVDLE